MRKKWGLKKVGIKKIINVKNRTEGKNKKCVLKKCFGGEKKLGLLMLLLLFFQHNLF